MGEDTDRRPSGLPSRNRRLPRRYRDDPPALPIPAPAPVMEEPTDFHSDAAPFVDDINMDSDDSNASRSSSTHSPVHVRTESDGNDLFRQYQGAFPSYDSENLTVLENLCDDSTFQQSEHNNEPGEHRESYFAPFLNATVWHLMEWFYSSTQKSIGNLDHLVHDVILADNFDREDLCDFSAQRETRRLDEAPRDPSSSRFTSDRWHTTSIPIRLPCERVKQSEENAPVFQVEGLHYCKITEVVRSAFEEPAAQTVKVPIEVQGPAFPIKVDALLDSGATGCFIDKSWALERRIELKPLKNPIPVLNVDGTRNQAGDITHFVSIIIKIGKHAEKLWCAVTCLGKTPLILGHTWLRKHNPDVDWSSGKITLNKCPQECQSLLETRFAKLLRKIEFQEMWVQAVKIHEQKSETPVDESLLEEAQKRVPCEYWKYLNVFSKTKSERMPVRKPWDHGIDLKMDFQPKKG